MTPRPAWILPAALTVAVGGVCVLLLRAGDKAAPTANLPPPAPTVAAAAQRFDTSIRPGPATPRVQTDVRDVHRQPVSVACVTCHQTTQPNLQTRSAAQLRQFHQGLTYQHGNLTCLSCHNAQNYDTLRLADGTTLPFAETMTLCAQCHGQKKRDYDHGAHGGMNGYWDLARGGRTRNTCTNCHDAHAPALPQVWPVLPPRDRLSVPAAPAKSH